MRLEDLEMGGATPSQEEEEHIRKKGQRKRLKKDSRA